MLADLSSGRDGYGVEPWHRRPVVTVIVVVLLLAALNQFVPVQEVLPAVVALLPLLRDRSQRAVASAGEGE
ncbi:hypothetical protein ABZ545_21985 [Streptomyces abikoensis]|uniref:hypothetical protein n=1 Tax=Streptomyces abikoensis TaxID=97398 RepID=UPI0033E1D45D